MRAAPEAYVAERTRFKREPRGDRFMHVVEIMIDGQYRPVLESVEPAFDGEPAADWPPSPPLKDWHFEERAAGAAFMAVGAAGKSHWSAAIEIARPATDKVSGTVFESEVRGRESGLVRHGARHTSASTKKTVPDTFYRVRFDVAARLAGTPRFLGSRYQCPATCRCIDATCVALLPGVSLQCDPATTRVHLDESSGTLVIEPLPISATAWPQTIRWRYWIP